MLKALHGWYQWKAEIESNLEVPSIQSTFWVMWRKFNIKLSHSVFTWPLFVRKCLFFQTNQPFTQTCDICTHIVSYMVGKLLKRSTFLRTQLHSYDANLKSYEFIPHAGISYMWDLTPHRMSSSGPENIHTQKERGRNFQFDFLIQTTYGFFSQIGFVTSFVLKK